MTIFLYCVIFILMYNISFHLSRNVYSDTTDSFVEEDWEETPMEKRPKHANRDKYNLAHNLLKDIAFTMSELPTLEFRENYYLLSELHDLIRQNKSIGLVTLCKYFFKLFYYRLVLIIPIFYQMID